MQPIWKEARQKSQIEGQDQNKTAKSVLRHNHKTTKKN
jgi:hypothetical protein